MTVPLDIPPLIRIFIGEPVQNRSEHDCLLSVCDALRKTGNWAYIFANFHAAGRQIDLVVMMEKSTLVIEVKGYSLPVRGNMNGQWEQLGPHGIRKTRNAYNQALDAKNAFCDEMRRVRQIEGYPNGLVVAVPIIPEGSTLTSGDFKVSVIGLDQLESQLSQLSGAHLEPDSCEALAKQLCLEEITNIGAALSDEVLISQRLCDTYLKAFNDFYGPQAKELVSDQYICDFLAINTSEVQSIVVGGNTGVLIHGPSGCGKTLLTTSCAISCIQTGCVPIIVSAKNFNGEFHQLLDKEVALLDARSASSVFAACRRLNKHIILFLDGYNECRDEFRISLTRSIRALALRYDAGIVVSSQQDIVRSDLLLMKTISVNRPSDELKAALSGIKEGSDNAENVLNLLQVATSGLEATLVGQVGEFLPAGASRFAVFDTYARKKLGTTATEGIRILSSFAEMLVYRSCFSISVREFDRLCDSTNIDHATRQGLLRSQLLQVRGDRVSFIHELFFSTFSAESAIRSVNGDLTRLRATLESPRFFSSKTFILGALEDDRAVHEILKGLADQDLLIACSNGECGAIAQSIVKREIERMLKVMIAEAKGFDFQIVGEGWNSVGADKNTLCHELKEFDAYLFAIGRGLMKGRYLDAAMAACRHMDQAITIFSKACAAGANGKKQSLRDEVFSAAYVMQPEAAISKLVNVIHSGGLSLGGKEGPGLGGALREMWSRAETPGEFYFLIGLTRFSEHDKEAAQYVAQWLRNLKSYPYHLQLSMIDFSQYLRDADEPYRTEIIETLESSLDKLGVVMNSIIFEALKSLGALEDDEKNYVPVIRDEIDNALNSETSESDVAAWGLFSCQFDHPFDSVYWDEIQGLDDSRKKLLFTKACRGAEVPYLSFLGILIRQLSEFNDRNV
ncbi:MAG TPA: NERD domain-containing protein, partial [Herbaspirillum sp.]